MCCSRLIALAMMLLSMPFPAMASFFSDYLIDPEDGMLDGSRYLSEVPLGFLPVPAIITEPAVGTGLAMVGVFFHESDEQKAQSATGQQSVLPGNISVIGLGGTDNGSKGAGLGHLGFWYGDRLRYRGFVLFPDFNLDFYSLGSLELNRPVELNLTGPLLVQELKFRIGDSNWFVGPRQVFRRVESELATGANVAPFARPELNQRLNAYIDEHIDRSTDSSALGVVTEYDSRNNPMGPTKGYYYSFQYMRFDSALGSDVEYHQYVLEGLNYWVLSEDFDLGLRLQYESVDPDGGRSLPPYAVPAVDLRGISATRYQGDQVATGEVELTYKLGSRWKINTFTGVARTGEHFSGLGSSPSVTNLGLGFRYLIARRYGFWMGADVAKGPEENAFYIQAGSTW